jgi:hypothetical protein
LVIKTLDPDWIRILIGIQPKMLDPDQLNADPQPCSKISKTKENELNLLLPVVNQGRV